MGVPKTFSELALRPELQAAVADQGYTQPTPIQAQAIPVALAGQDLLGIAQTGTGKTAAFTLPILQRLISVPAQRTPKTFRSLILTPTRELAIQIGQSIGAYSSRLPPHQINQSVIFGGVGQKPQVDALQQGLDILVATPGRLLDLTQQGYVRYDKVEVFVLDEADRMLDMGFIHDVKKVVAYLPPAGQRQSFFFSATMPPEVAKLATNLLRPNPVRVEVTPVATTAEKITQGIIHCSAADKRQLVLDLLSDPSFNRVILFTDMKHVANKYAALLEKASIPAAAIHGNKSQSARQAALEGFKRGTVRVLCATDIAARGIDVEAVSHVVNTSLPDVPEQYVHRIGRTARAGAGGNAVSFVDPDDLDNLRDIEKLIGSKIPEIGRPNRSEFVVPPPGPDRPPARGGRGRNQPSKRSAKSAPNSGTTTPKAPPQSFDASGGQATEGQKRKRNLVTPKKDSATTAATSGPAGQQAQAKKPQGPRQPKNGSGENAAKGAGSQEPSQARTQRGSTSGARGAGRSRGRGRGRGRGGARAAATAPPAQA